MLSGQEYDLILMGRIYEWNSKDEGKTMNPKINQMLSYMSLIYSHVHTAVFKRIIMFKYHLN